MIIKTLYGKSNKEKVEAFRKWKQFPEHKERLIDHIKSDYGEWEYQEIIGYLEFRFDFSDILISYSAVKKSRIFKSKTKEIKFITNSLTKPRKVNPNMNSNEILETIKLAISDCKNELNRRYIDQREFIRTCKYVDWKAMFHKMSGFQMPSEEDVFELDKLKVQMEKEPTKENIEAYLEKLV